MNQALKLFSMLGFSIILLTGSIPLSFAEYLSPLKQLESGIAVNDIQCKDNHILVIRTNGSPACVTERTAERTGWKVLKTEFIHAEKLVTMPEPTITPEQVTPEQVTPEQVTPEQVTPEQVTPEQVTPTIVMIDQSSDVEFVDDGREINYKSAGGLASPRDLYQYVIGKQMKHSEFQNDGEGNIRLSAVPHEKYSLKPNKTLYLEDWLPDYVPDGYKLLYSQTDWSEKAKQTTLTHRYVPTTFVLTEGFNTSDSIKSKGFEIGVMRTPYEISSIEDSIERSIQSNAMFGGHYGTGFVDMYRDGELIYAYSGGTTHHWYQAALLMQPDEYTSFIVSTNYLTLDEILPIFNSIGN